MVRAESYLAYPCAEIPLPGVKRQAGGATGAGAARNLAGCSRLADEDQALLAPVPAAVVLSAVLKRKKKALKSEDGKAGPGARRCQRDNRHQQRGH